MYMVRNSTKILIVGRNEEVLNHCIISNSFSNFDLNAISEKAIQKNSLIKTSGDNRSYETDFIFIT